MMMNGETNLATGRALFAIVEDNCILKIGIYTGTNARNYVDVLGIGLMQIANPSASNGVWNIKAIKTTYYSDVSGSKKIIQPGDVISWNVSNGAFFIFSDTSL